MKRVLLAIFLFAFVAACAAQVPKKKISPPETFHLSRWMREVSGHYVDLVTKLRADKTNASLYEGFLADRDRYVKRQAEKDDLDFYLKGLLPLQLLAEREVQVGYGSSFSKSKELRLLAQMIHDCEMDVRAATDTGQGKWTDLGDCKATSPELDEARAHDELVRLDINVRSMVEYCDQGHYSEKACAEYKSSDNYKRWAALRDAGALPSE
jgi:hypothetical protein